jgi:putative ABC transport system substrate-binding protein
MPSPSSELLREALSEHGYVEGQNLLIEWRTDEAQPERITHNATDLVAYSPDVLVAIGTDRAAAARSATASIPIVMVSGTDPVGAGLVQSFARPGGNVTGHIESHPQLRGQQLERLRQIVPSISRVTVLEWSSQAQGPGGEELESAARSLALQLRFARTPDTQALDDELARATGDLPDALFVVHSGFMTRHQARIIDFAARTRVPAIYGRRSYADAGGLAAYGPDLGELFSRAVSYVDRILKGARPADLPVEGPTRFDFVINLGTARSLGLIIPESVLAQTTELIH